MTKAERTRQFIIEQSAPIFNTKGVAATAISDIMAATKMAKGSLYVHFDSKEDLAYAAVDYNLDKLIQKIGTAINQQKTAKAKLFAYLDTIGDALNPPVSGGCPILNFGMEADDTNPVIKQKIDKVIQASREWITAIIEEGIGSGELVNIPDAGVLALKIFAMTEGGVLMARVAEKNEPMEMITKMIKKEIDAHTS